MVALSVLSYASFKPRIFFHDSGVHNSITSFNRQEILCLSVGLHNYPSYTVASYLGLPLESRCFGDFRYMDFFVPCNST